MPGITLAQAQAALNNALAAQAAILQGGTQYRYGERWIQCPPLVEVEASITRWNAEVLALEATGTAGGGRGPRISGITLGG